MNDKIGGRTPEEIKLGLEPCDCKDPYNCNGCEFSYQCVNKVYALALIRQLEAERDQYKRERDVAVESLRGICSECAHRGNVEFCLDCIYLYDIEAYGKKYNWQWRGPQEVEN